LFTDLFVTDAYNTRSAGTNESKWQCNFKVLHCVLTVPYHYDGS